MLRDDWGALFAGPVLAMIPMMAAYALLQPQMTAGFSMGGGRARGLVLPLRIGALSGRRCGELTLPGVGHGDTRRYPERSGQTGGRATPAPMQHTYAKAGAAVTMR
ncbi:hypothetical protein NDS46_07330 [Paenibacillus thiaminolyticus]|uniref:hypothetical protein n=1 Tax=Paenibacillus thiaminolyticus TaxID=49283 RepID=UPI002330316F|nr:hypothetical protein [Paenibacillus thiaminolyticus]WCF09675.1 hypothetical protein NDS46_07330 [Paenibacillus thiaminolyticus]